MRSKAGGWIGGAAFLALVILAATYFLAVSPKLAEAAETREFTEAEYSRHDLLRKQLSTLKAQFEQLPEFRAELAEIRTDMPPDAELTEFTRRLHDLADEHGVVIVGVQPSYPFEVTPPAPASPPADPEDDAELDADDTNNDGSSTSSTDGPGGAVMVAVSLSIVTIGEYANTVDFLEALQTSDGRLFLVTSINAISQDESAESNGRPETMPGDLELSIEGFVWVLPQDETAGEADDETDQPEVELPSSNRNPFVPLSLGSGGSSSGDEE